MPSFLPPVDQYPFWAEGGETGALIRSFDWMQTALGAPANWPPCLKQTLSIVLNGAFPMLICWGEEYIQLYNDAFLPVMGSAKHPSAIGKSARITFAEMWDSIGPMFGRVRKGETVAFSDFRTISNRNGYPEECFFDFSYSPIKDEHGAVGGILVICQETTEKLRAVASWKNINEELGAANEEYLAINEELGAANEEYLAINEELTAANEELGKTEINLKQALERMVRSEKLFRTIAINIPGSLIIVFDRELRYITIEGDLKEKLGYQSRDYEGRRPAEAAPAAQYQLMKPHYERMIRGKKFSVEHRTETGEDYIIHFVPLNDDGRVEAGLVIMLDITEVKQAEEKSAKLAAIIESSDDAIVSKTLDSVITSWNAAAERIFGYKASEIIGETIYKIIPPDRFDEEPAIIARLSRGERVDHFETKRVTKDGRLLDISVTISPVKDRAGRIIGVSKIARDITERKLAEARKNDFIGMVSHELKTPLTSLNAIIQLARKKMNHTDDVFFIGAMERAEVQVRRMMRMIAGFLDISRLESGKIRIERQDFDLDQVIREAVAEMELTSSRRTIAYHSCGAVIINADQDKTASVIINLLNNAIKYSQKDQPVTVKCEVGDAFVCISVSDEGIGIGPEDINKIFDRYYRIENEHTRHISGFGIGLYLSAEIIRLQGGEIWAKSELGKGSTFYFSLPLNPPASAAGHGSAGDI